MGLIFGILGSIFLFKDFTWWLLANSQSEQEKQLMRQVRKEERKEERRQARRDKNPDEQDVDQEAYLRAVGFDPDSMKTQRYIKNSTTFSHVPHSYRPQEKISVQLRTHVAAGEITFSALSWWFRRVFCPKGPNRHFTTHWFPFAGKVTTFFKFFLHVFLPAIMGCHFHGLYSHQLQLSTILSVFVKFLSERCKMA